MELAILAGVGLVGYYLSENDQHTLRTGQEKISSNDVPNGFDIYNQNRLSVAEQKQRDLAEETYEKSQYPTKTNVIPDYYNKLGNLINKTKLFRKNNCVDTMYNVNEDLDDIYRDMPFMRTSDPGNMNDIFKSTEFDRDNYFLNDEYEQFKFKTRKPTIKIPGVAKDPTEIQLKHWEQFQNIPDQNLLAVSEKLTDNADSIRGIMNEDVSGRTGACKRKQTPMDMVRNKRLVGVTGDLKSILVDDDTAQYPAAPVVPLGIKGSPSQSNRIYSGPIFKEDHDGTTPPADYPAYLAQFEEQTFDSDDLPSAPNDTYKTKDKARLAELERTLSYDGGWTQYDQTESMAYGVVPDDQLMHDNMVPYYSPKYGYGSNDLHNEHTMNFKNELFTGNLKTTWNKKQEVRPFFTPVADMSYIYGTPVRPEGEESRYIPSRYRRNEKLFDEERITPGLNLKYNEIGTHGYQDMFRSLPKNVDELRTRNNQKITYEGRIIPGQKGSARPVQAPVISHRPDGFKVTTEADLLPKIDFNDGPRVRENFIMKETDRASQHIEYTGGAYTAEEAVGQNVPEEMRPKIKFSDRQNFTLPKPLQKFAKEQTAFNPNYVSYDVQFNARSQTGPNTQVGPLVGARTYANNQDTARNTLKEISSTTPYNYGPVKPNTMRGTVQPMDIANPTLREITAENSLNPNAIGTETRQKVYYPDVARITTRETTCDPIAPANITQNTNTYANLTDDAKLTMKETTVQIPQNTHVLAVGQSQSTVHPQDIMRTTTRESTVQIPYQTTVVPVGQYHGAPHLQDRVRTTIREETVQIPYETFISAVDQKQGARHPQDTMRTTIKEGTVQTPRNTFVSAVDQKQGARHPQDIMRTTMKENTVQIPRNTFVSAVDQKQGARHPQDMMRTTMKESTVQTPWNTFVSAVDQKQGARHPQDIARTTIREGTVQVPYQTFVSAVDQQQGAVHPQDVMRTTMKENTVQIPYETFISAVDQQQGAVHPQDVMRTTMKEGTVQIPYETFVMAIDQQQGAVHLQDVARTTIKEGTVQIPYQTNIAAMDQQQGAVHLQDMARTTMKEGTVQIPYQTNIAAVDQQQGHAFNWNPLRATTKETTVDNDYVPGPTNDVYAKGFGYMAENPYAHNTNRQFTTEEVYIPPLQGDPKSRSYNAAYNAPIDDRKDRLHWYRPPTASGVNLGPIKEQINMHLKKDNYRSPEPMPGFSINNNLDRLIPKGFTRAPDLMVPMDHFIDPKILAQLNANPYNIPYYGLHYEQTS